MNILPKKRWHVRTKENIARVRRDEAEAAEKEKLEQQRIENADREARLNALKQKSKQKLIECDIQPATSTEQPVEHINLFHDFDKAIKKSNKEHDIEVKEKQEEYEKKIGYLTYLGQDTNEALQKKNWYEVLPESSRFSRSHEIKDTYEKLVIRDKDGKPKAKELDVKDGEVAWKVKQSLDPINAFRKYCHGTKKNIAKNNAESKHRDKSVDKNSHKSHEHKKQKQLKGDDEDEKKNKLLKLREARLKREKEEKRKTELFLNNLHGVSNEEQNSKPQESRVKPKYNSQFNPELARQNYR